MEGTQTSAAGGDGAPTATCGALRKKASKVFSAQDFDAGVKERRRDWRVELVEGVHQHLHVQLVHVLEEAADAILIPHVVQQHETDVPGRDKSADEVVVELIHALEVHVLRAPDRLVHHVERSVDDELVEVRRVLPLHKARVRRSGPLSGALVRPRHPLCVEELCLVDGCVTLRNHDEHLPLAASARQMQPAGAYDGWERRT